MLNSIGVPPAARTPAADMLREVALAEVARHRPGPGRRDPDERLAPVVARRAPSHGSAPSPPRGADPREVRIREGSHLPILLILYVRGHELRAAARNPRGRPDLVPRRPDVHRDPRGARRRGDQGGASRPWRRGSRLGAAVLRGGSVLFFAANRSKRSLALDLKDARGKEALLRLVDGADVFAQSMRGGTAERQGLGEPRRCAAATSGSSTARSAHSARPARSRRSRDTTRSYRRSQACQHHRRAGPARAFAWEPRSSTSAPAYGPRSACSRRSSSAQPPADRPRCRRGPARHRALAGRVPADRNARERRGAGALRDGVSADRTVRGVRDGRWRADDRRGERRAVSPALRTARPSGARRRPALRHQPRPPRAS